MHAKNSYVTGRTALWKKCPACQPNKPHSFPDQWGAENIRFRRTPTGREVDLIIDGKIACEVKFNVDNFRPSKYRAFRDRYIDIKFNLLYRKGGNNPGIRDSVGFMQIEPTFRTCERAVFGISHSN